jgi:hypothetical protein
MQKEGPLLKDAVKGCQVVHKFSHTPPGASEGDALNMRVLHCIPATASEDMRTLHARMHPLLFFYIDAASELQQEDANMHLLLLVKYVQDAPKAVLGMLSFFECAARCDPLSQYGGPHVAWRAPAATVITHQRASLACIGSGQDQGEHVAAADHERLQEQQVNRGDPVARI